MDVWVVKYASRQSRIGDFSGDLSVRGARIRGVLASHASAGQRGLSAQGVEPDGRGFAAGIRPFGVGRMTARAIGAVLGGQTEMGEQPCLLSSEFRVPGCVGLRQCRWMLRLRPSRNAG